MKLFRDSDGYLIVHNSSCNRKALIHVDGFIIWPKSAKVSSVEISGRPCTWRLVGVDVGEMNVIVSWVLV